MSCRSQSHFLKEHETRMLSSAFVTRDVLSHPLNLAVLADDQKVEFGFL